MWGTLVRTGLRVRREDAPASQPVRCGLLILAPYLGRGIPPMCNRDLWPLEFPPQTLVPDSLFTEEGRDPEKSRDLLMIYLKAGSWCVAFQRSIGCFQPHLSSWEMNCGTVEATT